MILGTWASHALGFAGEVLARVVIEPLAEVVVRRFEPAPGASLGCEFCESMSEETTRLAMRVRELEEEVVHLRLDEAHTQQLACTVRRDFVLKQHMRELSDRERDVARDRVAELERRLRQRGGNVLAAFPTEPPLRVVEDEDP